MTQSQMKRFYETAEIASDDDGWTILLDGRAIKTPARADLKVTSKALADAIAKEWASQGDMVDVPSLHLTRLVNVAIDRTPIERGSMVEEVARYCETDLTCFLAETPPELRDRQIVAWRPVREQVGKALGIVLMEAPGGVLHMPQPPASLQAALAHAGALDDFRLTALLYGMGLFGSAILALAVEQGMLAASDAYEHSVLDEVWQAEKWGADPENEARLASQRAEADRLDRVFAALDT